jgi:hypothetical protein
LVPWEVNYFDYKDKTKVHYFDEQELSILGKNVIEIDKVAIFPEHHSIHNLNRMLVLIFSYLKTKHSVHGLALLEPKFFSVLKKFGLAKQIGQKKEYKGDDVIPSLIFIDNGQSKANSVLRKALKQSRQKLTI